jgi:hypothetical protein
MTKKYLDRIVKLLIPEQLDIFYKMYPEGPAPKQVKWAINQIENTILAQNRESQKLRDIKTEFEEFKKAAEDREAAHVRAFQHITKELAQTLKENERLSASKVDVDNANIIEKLEKLYALEATGVDNWEWYDEAMESIDSND